MNGGHDAQGKVNIRWDLRGVMGRGGKLQIIMHPARNIRPGGFVYTGAAELGLFSGW
jgi:hypothetical protein